jgi:hypothetical protein
MRRTAQVASAAQKFSQRFQRALRGGAELMETLEEERGVPSGS